LDDDEDRVFQVGASIPNAIVFSADPLNAYQLKAKKIPDTENDVSLVADNGV
jgi:hypothetical protein